MPNTLVSMAFHRLMVGEQVTCFCDRLITFHGKGGRVFWLVLQKMEKRYSYPNIPRFTKLDAERFCLEQKSLRRGYIWPNMGLSRDMFDGGIERERHIVCLGDSMHKQTETQQSRARLFPLS